MLAVFATVLLAAIAVFAGSAIVATWREFGQAALALRGKLRQTGELRQFDWTARELNATRSPTSVRQLPLKAPRVVLQSGLRAAA